MNLEEAAKCEEPTKEMLEEFFPAELIGPTWQRDEDGKFILPERTLGWHILAWVRENLTNFNDDGPMTLTGEQSRFILWFYALDESNVFAYRAGVLQRLKGWGKDPLSAVLCIVELIGPCRYSHDSDSGIPLGKPHPNAWVGLGAVSLEQPLALDTKVRTASGWTTVGELRVGDFVFDENGELQEVKRETEVYEDKDCYRVTWRDGQSVVASAGHGWTVNIANKHTGKMEKRTLTTQELAEYGDRYSKSTDLAPVMGEDIDLPVDPYYMGYWLGDGHSYNSSLAVGSQDYDALYSRLSEMLKPGQHISIDGPRDGVSSLAIVQDKKPGNGKLISVYQNLKGLGVIKNKHLPEIYLRASYAQRLRLLQGMIDSDGHCYSGNVLFTNKNERIIEGYVALARSLGFDPKVHKAFGGAKKVGFTNYKHERVATLERKLAGALAGEQKPGRKHIASIEKVDSVPVKCIGIDTESHLFQVEHGILTHNTRNTRSLFNKIIPERTREKYGMRIMSEIITARGGKARLHAYGSNAGSVEGVRFTFFLLNETQHWNKSNRLEEVYLTVRGNVSKDPLVGHYLCITNAYNPGENSVAEQIRKAQEDVWSGMAESDKTLYDSLEAHPAVPLNSKWAPLVIEQIRGDATWLTWLGVQAEVLAGDMAPSRKRRMWYNQIVTTEEALFTPKELDAAVPEGALGSRKDLKPGDEITLGFDGGRTDDSTALVAMRLSDKMLIPIAIWQKPEGMDGWTIDTARVNSVVHQTFALYDVKAFYADVNLWESFINEWSDDYREVLTVKATGNSPIALDMRGHGKRISANNEAFLQSIRDGALFFNGSKTLRQHMLNAEARFDNSGLKFAKAGGRESGRKIDALVAATLAFMAYRDMQEAKKATPKKQYRGTLLRA